MSINDIKFYQFIADYQSKNGNWAESIDSDFGNGDGTLTKSEFSKFLDAEWDWNGEESSLKDLVNEYWKKIDTNTKYGKISGTNIYNMNGLDEKEMKKVQEQIDYYNALDAFVSNVTIPDDLAIYSFKATLIEKLQGLTKGFIGKSPEDVEQAFANNIEQAFKETAVECSYAYAQTVYADSLSGYPEYRLAEDKTLAKLIKDLTFTLSEDGDYSNFATEIKDTVLETVRNYINEAIELDGTPCMGDDATTLSELQRAVITQEIRNKATENGVPKDIADLVDSEINKLITKLLSQGKTYGELRSLTVEDLGIENINLAIECYNTYADITATTDDTGAASGIYKELVEALGKDIADAFVTDDIWSEDYTKILRNVVQKIISGDIATKDDAWAEIKTQIMANTTKMYENLMETLPVETLETIYTNQQAGATEMIDDDKDAAIKLIRDAAITLCKALIAKGDGYAQVVKDVFGDDYAGYINKNLPGSINIKINAVLEKAKTVEKYENTELTWTNISEFKLAPNKTKSLAVTATVTDGSAQVSSYETVVTDGSAATVEIDSSGNLTIKAGKDEGSVTVEVYAIIDGVRVGKPQKIVITVAEPKTIDANKIGSAEDLGLSHYAEAEWRGNSTGDGNIRHKDRAWAAARDAAISKLKEQCKQIYNALVAKGYEIEFCKTAITEVYNT